MRSNTTQRFVRKDVRELGMTLVINARKKTPPPHLYKALLMAQVKTTILHTCARENNELQPSPKSTHTLCHQMLIYAKMSSFVDSQIRKESGCQD